MGSAVSEQPHGSPAVPSSNGVDEKQAATTASFSEDLEGAAADEDAKKSADQNVAVPMITKAMRRKSWLQFAALCMSIYVAGWNDGTTGPLVPRLQEVYHVREVFTFHGNP